MKSVSKLSGKGRDRSRKITNDFDLRYLEGNSSVWKAGEDVLMCSVGSLGD